ncbi:Aste57867_9536 [Aphanomyces stellatus]|uniref:Aste57867_9536 protein n=1 Tax=Aphanomyces stellatus TaxID=120398 RepID=A0A485KNG1_9STRA|nr:hypothetical protein As57867_009499 [Aphanomyces stellatus]VFT86415.1 Aste57867_9536 [Aphanomyces stellatus]
MKVAAMEMQVYRAVWNVCWPLVRWLVRVKDSKRQVPALAFVERMGVAQLPSHFKLQTRQIVWIHGASVGECLSALPLIKFLTHESTEQALPIYHVLLTTTTPSARTLLKQRLDSNPKATCIFAPLDHAPCVKHFLDTWKPTAAIWIESEIWPNMIVETGARQIPMAILNGRMSLRSFEWWHSWLLRRLAQHLLGHFRMVLCQSPADMHRFQLLGHLGANYLGDLKFVAEKGDIDPVALHQLRESVQSRSVWTAASTHDGEEAVVLRAHDILLSKNPRALLILIPRHPHRVSSICHSLKTNHPQLNVTLRSQDRVPAANSNVFIVDTMGETQLCFEVSRVVFVGGALTHYDHVVTGGLGSLVPIGGHNILEPLRSGCTVLHGPHMTNFTSVLETLQSPDTVVQVTAMSLPDMVAQRLASPASSIGESKRPLLAPIQAALWSHVTRFLTS